jgi:hypothetical protein
MSAFLDTHFAIATFLYPLVNTVVLIHFVIGTVRTSLKRPFAILAIATVLFLVPQCANLLYFLKKTLDLGFPSPAAVCVMFPFQAIAEYVAFPLDIVGVVLLLKALMRDYPRTPTNG